MSCFKLVNGSLQAVPDPIDNFADSRDVEAAIYAAGYTIRVCNTQLDDGASAQVAIYETEKDQPRYYIEVMGTQQIIASFIAEDFPALLATLKELHPLLSLIGLDQRARIYADDVNAREDRQGNTR